MNQTQTENTALKGLEETEAYNKYQGKRIRISRFVYIVDIFSSDLTPLVIRLQSVTSGTTATNMVNRDSYPYEAGGPVFRKAVDFCYDLEREIEDGLPVDYVIPTE
jgi:hypothetical protein